MPCVPQGISTGTSALPSSVKVLASRTRRKVLFSCTWDQIWVMLQTFCISLFFLTIFVSGVTQLWLILQGCTCFSGCDDDWQDHSVIFLGSIWWCNKDGLRRVQAGVTPHLSSKKSGYASSPCRLQRHRNKNGILMWCGLVSNEVSLWPIENLQLLSVDVHLEQGISKDVSKAAGVEVAVRSAIALLIVDLRELQAAILQQLIVV